MARALDRHPEKSKDKGTRFFIWYDNYYSRGVGLNIAANKIRCLGISTSIS